jgi:hypothetical protein
MAHRYSDRDEEPGMHRGGRYGVGGLERAYNQGGYGGRASYEEGYARGSYDRMLDMTERSHGYRGEEYDDELTMPGAVGFGREPWGDEWMSFDRSRGERRGKAPKGYTRSDERIREDICERLMISPYDASDVEITVSRGEVTLTGMVHSRVDKWGIEDMADDVLGVQDVHNQIRVSRGEAQTAGTTLAGDTGGHLHS